jgi:hypothetical protein
VILSLAEVFYVADVWRRDGSSGLSDIELIGPLVKTFSFVCIAVFVGTEMKNAFVHLRLFIIKDILVAGSMVRVWGQATSKTVVRRPGRVLVSVSTGRHHLLSK